MQDTVITIIRPDGTEETRTVSLADKPSYAVLKPLVEPALDGAWMEHVSVLHDGARTDMFVDEEGLNKGLPFNAKATAIYRASWLKARPNTNPDTLPPIVGTAVLFSRRVWF